MLINIFLSGWVDEKNLRPYSEFREEFKDKGKLKDQGFIIAINDIDSFIENPENFSALFEQKAAPTAQKKTKGTPKPKKQDFDADFDSLKSDSSVPSSPSVSKTSLATPTPTPTAATETPKAKPTKQRTSSARSIEKVQKVPEPKRKLSTDSEDGAKEEEVDPKDEEMEVDEPVAPSAAKKARKSNSNSTPKATTRNASTSSSSGRRSEVEADKSIKSPTRSSTAAAAVVAEPSGEIYGMVGLGIMGSSIVENLIGSGYEVVIYNRDPAKCDKFPNCTVVQTPREVFEQAQITFICVADSDAVKEVICDGINGIIAAETPESDKEKGLIMLSSIDCETSADMRNAMLCKGNARYLEAQIQGSRESAQNGDLIIIGSGDKSLYEDAKGCFKAISKNSYFLGEEIGAAIKMNMVLQTMAGVQLAALAEALSLADTLGLQQRDILEIISLSNLNSEFIYQKGEVITSEKYREPSMKVDTMSKDLKMAIEFGDSLNHPLPLVAASKELFKTARRMGFGQDDSAAIYYAANFNKFAFDYGNSYENGTV